MFAKILNFFYLLFVLLIGVLALAMGASNGQVIEVNLWLFKVNATIASVMSIAMLVGGLFVSVCWLYFVVKQRLKIAQLSRRLRFYEEDKIKGTVEVNMSEAKRD